MLKQRRLRNARAYMLQLRMRPGRNRSAPTILLGLFGGAVDSIIQIHHKGMHTHDKGCECLPFWCCCATIQISNRLLKKKRMMAPYAASQYYALSYLRHKMHATYPISRPKPVRDTSPRSFRAPVHSYTWSLYLSSQPRALGRLALLPEPVKTTGTSCTCILKHKSCWLRI